LREKKKEISELKDMLSKYLSINEKPKSQDGEKPNRRKDKMSEPYSHNEEMYIIVTIAWITTKNTLGNIDIDPIIIIQKKQRLKFLPFMAEKMLKNI